ncbi:MAG: hypothetical protein QOI26_2434 [Pseudonocardiales bacterium]|nr:hypothetical protein [Pseudonocardiales bacterium]
MLTSKRTATAVALGAAVALAGCSSARSPGGAPAAATSSASSIAAAEVSFNGVTVGGAADLTAKPRVVAKSVTAPAALQVKDVVIGSGAAATPKSTVTVQYVGVRYADGKQFDASWDLGGATSFSLRGVAPGFTQGIGGAPGIEPRRVGGRRIMILPAALGYGRTGRQDGSIPPNAPIAFVVDLIAVK